MPSLVRESSTVELSYASWANVFYYLYGYFSYWIVEVLLYFHAETEYGLARVERAARAGFKLTMLVIAA